MSEKIKLFVIQNCHIAQKCKYANHVSIWATNVNTIELESLDFI